MRDRRQAAWLMLDELCLRRVGYLGIYVCQDPTAGSLREWGLAYLEGRDISLGC